MFDLDKWQEILESLKRHKLRTMLTALSVWWGIFMLIILLGAGAGLENSAKRDFSDDAENTFFIYGGVTSKEHNGLKPGRYIQFVNEDRERIKDHVPTIKYTSGRFHLWGSFVIKYKRKALSFDVRSIHPEHKYIEGTEIIDGRFINDLDIQSTRKVCLIGDLVRDELIGEGVNPLGQYINIKGVDFMIVGLFTDAGSKYERRNIYLPVTTAQKVFSTRDNLHQILATSSSTTMEETQRVKAMIKEQLAASHEFSSDDDQAVYVYNNFEEYQDFQAFFSMLQGFLWFVGIGSILAGVIGVSNIMLIIVKDRTREIGIRKALGATPRSIILMIVWESVFLTGVSGYIGLLTGFGLIEGLSYLMEANDVDIEFFYNPSVSPAVIFSALFILIISGVLAGYFPAKKAASISAVEAMKN